MAEVTLGAGSGAPAALLPLRTKFDLFSLPACARGGGRWTGLRELGAGAARWAPC